MAMNEWSTCSTIKYVPKAACTWPDPVPLALELPLNSELVLKSPRMACKPGEEVEVCFYMDQQTRKTVFVADEGCS